jgi:group I intron endonuclease
MAKLPKITCIYKITSPTGKVYIGQTRNVLLRFRAHRNYKWCKYKSALINSLAKYGHESHLFDIIHLLPNDVTQPVLDAYEQLYMDCYSDCSVHLLNSKEGGYKGAHSQDAKVKMSLSAKLHLNNNPNKIEEYATRLNKAKAIWQKENPGYIDDKIKDLKKGAKEWREKNPEAVKINIKKANNASAAIKTGVKRSMEDRKKISEGQFIPIAQFDKTGNFISHWPSIKSAAKTIGIHNSTIVHCLKGKLKTAGGFTWRYK